ncbi:hypothetical protein GYMLUDRAFT_251322 [Collybiopsis luxurians FD-317 M1]|uniref:Uncharacterized protein n=1 Tax=Collybiopsis luxurians FD-317 M1 TaxID=944289 RepID=A0A0D0BCQ9_9AGAR|nr:hypothetical protein GYMLUDRAFT_251322 [Collybiopsis luxurians FD-317 M1]
MSTTSQSLVTAPRFPKAKQLVGEDNWREYKREVLLTVQSRSLMGYLSGTIPQPSSTHLTTSPTYIYSTTPLPEEWSARDAITKSVIVTNIADPVGLGVDETKNSASIWKGLVDKFKKWNKQKIKLADDALRKCIYDPKTPMEEHEKKMCNLLKRLHNAGGTCTDEQFRLIVIASVPKEWKPDVQNVPGTDSESAFTFLHALYLEKRQEVDEEERDLKRVKALMAKYPEVYAAAAQSTQSGHTKARCWASGGGMEGKAPKWWQSKTDGTNTNVAMMDTQVNAIETNLDPSELYVLAAIDAEIPNTNKPSNLYMFKASGTTEDKSLPF